MTDTNDFEVDAATFDVVASDLRADGEDPIVENFVLVANWLDGDGKPCIYANAPHGQTITTTVGLLVHALVRELTGMVVQHLRGMTD